jgi:hypothetical protein
MVLVSQFVRGRTVQCELLATRIRTLRPTSIAVKNTVSSRHFRCYWLSILCAPSTAAGVQQQHFVCLLLTLEVTEWHKVALAEACCITFAY